ncbi:AAA family ATPase [Persicobacter psychrovividus]|uniref:Endonuclease GajA/Old nuclease/RecF-like AAA domain-containing protein n=1 Tax=Persicobacter psychrovividus TaxID=387638 RepID=A0ABM7VM55_9BACT|nr:hypothetical protein PEPS_43710 [Persicobacter psychrovividus]
MTKPHLQSLSIKNFRFFKERTTFNIAPINVITGTNSSGKSSVLKALRLLSESSQKHGLRKLNLSSKTHQLGDFEQVKNKYSDNKYISFSYQISNTENLFWGVTDVFYVHLIFGPQYGALDNRLLELSISDGRQPEGTCFAFEMA